MRSPGEFSWLLAVRAGDALVNRLVSFSSLTSLVDASCGVRLFSTACSSSALNLLLLFDRLLSRDLPDKLSGVYLEVGNKMVEISLRLKSFESRVCVELLKAI